MNQQRHLISKFAVTDRINVDLIYFIFMGNNADICLCNCKKYFIRQQHEKYDSAKELFQTITLNGFQKQPI